jgi:plasmid maintenance system antidote protein VapI
MLRLSQEFDLNNTEIAYVLSLDRRHVSRILMGRRQNKVTGIIREEI